MAANSSNLLMKQNYSDGSLINITNYSSNVTTALHNTHSTPFQFPAPAYPPGGTGVLAFMAAVTSLFTTTGNILVVISFIVEKNLRQPSNYLIASLAVTDILIGMFSMPFYSLYLLMRYWPLGQTLCDLWLSLDFTVCLVSQYTVFLITLDRFCSVKAPAKYRNWRTKCKIKIMIAVTWLFPAFIFFTSIMGWRKFTGSEPPTDFTCAVEFQSHQLFTVILVISYYWVTLIIMTGLYIGIYQVAWSLHAKSKAKRTRMSQMRRLTNNNSSATKNTEFTTVANGKPTETKRNENRASSKIPEREDTSEFSNDPCSSDSSSSRRQESNEQVIESVGNSEHLADTFERDTTLSESPLWKPRDSFESNSIHWEVFNKQKAEKLVEGGEVNQLIDDEECTDAKMEVQPPAEVHPVKESSSSSKSTFLTQFGRIITRLRKVNWIKRRSEPDVEGRRKKSRGENRARKALKTISFILGAFVLCWTPYHVVIIVYSFCPSCVNLTFYEFTYWLCYMNSPLNPFCYALSNRQFKRAFIRILKGEYFRSRTARYTVGVS